MTYHWRLPKLSRSIYEAGTLIGWVLLLAVVVMLLISGRLG